MELLLQVSMESAAMLLHVSVLVILLASSRGIPYYITSSADINGNTTCVFKERLLQPCSSLETLVVNQNFGENLTLLFLPGRYVVRNSTHLNFTSFQVITLSPLNQNTLRIICETKMSITFWYVSIIVINSLEFDHCGYGYNRHIIGIFWQDKYCIYIELFIHLFLSTLIVDF